MMRGGWPLTTRPSDETDRGETAIEIATEITADAVEFNGLYAVGIIVDCCRE